MEDALSIERLQEAVVCPVCHNEFEDPRFLPCHHYYCKRCILILAHAVPADHPFTCPDPECCRAVSLPGNDLEDLPRASFLNMLKDRLKEAIGEAAPTSPTPPFVCTIHNIQQKIFCYDCNHLICPECALSHRTADGLHHYDYVKNACGKSHGVIKEKGAQLRGLLKLTGNAVDTIRGRKTEVRARAENMSEEVRRSFDEIRRVLREREDELVGAIKSMSDQKIAALEEQEKDVQNSAAKLEEVLSVVDTTLKSNDEFQLFAEKGLTALIQKEIDRPRHYMPCEVPNVTATVDCLSEIKRICCLKSKVYLSKAYGSGLHRAEVGKVSSFLISPLLFDGENPRITVSVVSDVDTNTVLFSKIARLPTAQKKTPLYEVTYSATLRGHHKVMVEIDGAPIEGSPFSMLASVDPMLLGKSVCVLKGLNHPYGVAFNSSDEMIVSESHIHWDTNQVTVRDKNGNKLHDMVGYKPCHPQGVAVDDDDNIYVVENGGHCISKFDHSGQFIKVMGKQGTGEGEFKAPRGIAVAKNEVYVCDSGNGRIQILNTDLEYLRTIAGPETKAVTDITTDSTGKLYVVSHAGNAPVVQVFDPVRLVPLQPVQHSSLAKPSGICFDPILQLIFVCDWGNSCICVFKTSGEFVTRFGKDGVGDGDFKNPFGIASDKEGYVYVCDYTNNRISVF